MLGEKALDSTVEGPRPEGLPLRETGARRAEALLEREVDCVQQLDGHRVVEHRIVPARLARTVIERPHECLRNALKIDGHDQVSRASAVSKRARPVRSGGGRGT